MEAEEYHRLIREGFDLAFEHGDLQGGAERYAQAFATHPAEIGYSSYRSEYAPVVHQLGRDEEALEQRRLAVRAALSEYPQEPEGIVVAHERHFLGEQLLAMGRAVEALEAVSMSVGDVGAVAAHLLCVKAEALSPLGGEDEAAAVAVEAESRATDKQKGGVVARMSRWLSRP